MSVRYLKQLFKPTSVAVIGASNTADSVGGIVMRNLLQGGFTGPILPVNPKYQAVQGVLAYPSVAALPLVPDMAVIAVPPDDTLNALRALAERGTRAAIIVASGLGWAAVKPDVATAIRDTARTHGIRVLGPNSLGVLVPGIGLNASFAPQPANKGRIAFVSQSGAVCTSVLDWARPPNWRCSTNACPTLTRNCKPSPPARANCTRRWSNWSTRHARAPSQSPSATHAGHRFSASTTTRPTCCWYRPCWMISVPRSRPWTGV